VLRIYENYSAAGHVILFVQRSDILETIIQCCIIEGDAYSLQHFAAGKTRPSGHFDEMARSYPYVWRLLMTEEHV
jgi:hypothetical protein